MILAFRLGPIPVRVHAGFLVAALVLGLSARHGPVAIAMRTAGFFATALAHDLAHAAAARSFGAPAEVHLTLSRGGFGSWIRTLSPARRAVVSLAGPAASLAIAAVAMATTHVRPSGGEGVDALRYFGFINLGWGLLNLLPILPLDAGHALVAVLNGDEGRGEQAVRWLSVACCVVLGLVGTFYRVLFPVFICGFLALHNATALRALGARNEESILRVRLKASFDALERGARGRGHGHRTLSRGPVGFNEPRPEKGRGAIARLRLRLRRCVGQAHGSSRVGRRVGLGGGRAGEVRADG